MIFFLDRHFERDSHGTLFTYLTVANDLASHRELSVMTQIMKPVWYLAFC